GAWTSRAQLEETSAPHWLGYMAGISGELPIADWGAIASRIDQQSANLGARRSEYRIMQRHLEAEYQGDVLEHATALRKLARLEANYRRALDQYRLIQSKYAGGGSSGLEVLD